MELTSWAFGESDGVFGIERVTYARRIKTKNEQIVSTEKRSVEDDDFREEPRG